MCLNEHILLSYQDALLAVTISILYIQMKVVRADTEMKRQEYPPIVVKES